MGGRGSLGKGAGTERGSRPQATGRPHTPGGQATASLRPELQMGFASVHTQHLHNEHQEQEVPGPFKKNHQRQKGVGLKGTVQVPGDSHDHHEVHTLQRGPIFPEANSGGRNISMFIYTLRDG